MKMIGKAKMFLKASIGGGHERDGVHIPLCIICVLQFKRRERNSRSRFLLKTKQNKQKKN
jgi:hypothetical protein